MESLPPTKPEHRRSTGRLPLPAGGFDPQANIVHPLADASVERWSRISAERIEHFQEAVLGAGLDAIQLSRGAMQGSLAFAASDGIIYSSGYLGGQVALRGSLSDTMITLGTGINIGTGSRHWLKEVETGGVGVFLPGDEHDALYTPGSIYACATLSCAHLEELAADMGLVLDAKVLGGSGISPRTLSRRPLASLKNAFGRLHAGKARGRGPAMPGRYMLERMIATLAREPRHIPGAKGLDSRARIVARAQDYIAQNLEYPLSITAIAQAAAASPSSLYRAFHELLAETPQSFVRKLRLNRIRQDLATASEVHCSITLIANRWGISELGRLAGWYRELFGELPSRTRTRRMDALRRRPRTDLTRSA